MKNTNKTEPTCFKKYANENAKNRFTDFFIHKSDIEIEVIAGDFSTREMIAEMYNEAGVGDITRKCNKIVQKISKIPMIGDVAVDVNVLCIMLNALVKKEYIIPNAPFVIARILFALVYFISPIDIIPDYIPFIGYIDDWDVIIYIKGQIYSELQGFKEYMKEKDKNEFKDACYTEIMNRAMENVYFEYEEEIS